MKKLSDFKLNKKVYTEDEKLQNDKKKLIIYVVVFAVLIIFMRFTNNANPSNTNSNNNTNNQSEVKDNVLELLTELKNNNYEMNLSIIVDTDLVNIIKRIQDKDTEIYYITYRGNESTYFRHKDNYFTINGETIERSNSYTKIYEYDETFLDMKNLITLLEDNSISAITLQEEKYNIKRYKIPLNNVLTDYNKIHNTNEFTSLNKEISIDIRYKTSLTGIFMNMTHYNNYLLDSNYTTFTYEISFTDINKVDLSSIVQGVENL